MIFWCKYKRYQNIQVYATLSPKLQISQYHSDTHRVKVRVCVCVRERESMSSWSCTTDHFNNVEVVVAYLLELYICIT